MTTKHQSVRKVHENFYSVFDQLDGHHPWAQAVPEGFVGYRVRELKTGKVVYFNYILAKEMGLLPADHPTQMSTELENKLIETFSLQIINEYDELSQRRFDEKTIRPNKYMATRYLQLQHSNKQGKTSGDGRGIWNGIIENKNRLWDVSSRGTGVTCLAPGAVMANKPLRTGDTDFGYGCGQAEIDELLGAAILAEVMHLQGIHTERVLCVIDLGKGFGIGVRAAPNLIRPAHLFLYLKQERHAELKAAADYLIDRQVTNHVWKIKSKSAMAYQEMLDYLTTSFAKFTAQLDIDYIFAWLDWDGDNVLADAGIIDYGSVRQFGLRHDKYRYDDVERFSTNLNEQRKKARQIVQVFSQMVDFIVTGQKKPIRDFQQHAAVKKFDREFNEQRAHRVLYRLGFNPTQRENILHTPGLFQQFDKIFSFFERAKISGSMKKVADGVNHPPLYNIRSLSQLLPLHLTSDIPEREIFGKILSSFSKTRDARMGEKQKRQIQNLRKIYFQLVKAAAGQQKPESIVKGLRERAEKLNSDHRITGNALIEMVDEILSEKKKGLPLLQIQKIIDRLILGHKDLPEVSLSRFYKDETGTPAVKVDLFARLMNLVDHHKEDI